MTAEKETLFLRTLEDLERRLLDEDPYVVLGAAALIRKLLLDDHPLVDQVNRQHRIKLSFEISSPLGPPPGLPPPSFFSVQDGIDPDTAPPFKKRIQVSRDQLFQTVLTVVDNHKYSMREIVLFESNVMGAVHAGSPRSDKEKALHEIDSTISVGGYASSLRQLKGIGRVVVKALTPIKKVIEANA